ncbi:hypothetical protein [Sphingorhabdus pulchriflava]|uniref:hypothetical protein n=1 Tax=Sphingorhabdus pulchriflava TaxID=2292257 RepID=UPI0011C0643C|nr:hypothetical protein [Sphingorhabdus pulchriflava]
MITRYRQSNNIMTPLKGTKVILKSSAIVLKCALLASFMSGTANASGLTADLSKYPGAHPQMHQGLGAQVRLSAPVGGTKTKSKTDQLRLNVEAGPQLLLSRRDATTLRSLAPMIQFSYLIGRSEQLSVAGIKLYDAQFVPMSYSDREALKQVKAKAGISTAGWVGIGVGAAAALGFYLMATGELSGPTD